MALNQAKFNSKRSRATSAALSIVMVFAGIAVLFVPLKVINILEFIVFILLAMLGVILIVRFAKKMMINAVYGNLLVE